MFGKQIGILKHPGYNGKSDPPPAPDYAGAAQATAAGNLEAARATAAANRVNQYTPYGSLEYKPTTTDMYGNQLYSVTQTLSPAEQQKLAQTQALDTGLLNTAQSGLNYANSVLSSPGIDLSKLTQVQSQIPNQNVASSYNVQQATGNVANPNVQTSFDTSKLPSTGINPGETYSDAIMRRLAPTQQRQTAQLETQLMNQGIAPGTEAWNNAKTQQAQEQNDQLTSAIIGGMQTGLSANQQAYNQALGLGQFANQAAGQQFGQNLSAAQLANQAAAQNTGNYANLAQLQNQAAQQQFNQQLQNAQLANTAQQQQFNQAGYNQMLPINVINALRTGTQVNTPNYVNPVQQAQTGGADLLGAQQASYNAQLAATNAQNAASGGFMGGLMNLGGAYLLGKSDRRLKENIKKIGSLDNGLNLYSYNYKEGFGLPEGRQVGVMADEVEKIIPEAVVMEADGYKAVNYAMLGA